MDSQRQMGTEWIRQKSQQIVIDERDADRDQTKAGTTYMDYSMGPMNRHQKSVNPTMAHAHVWCYEC